MDAIRNVAFIDKILAFLETIKRIEAGDVIKSPFYSLTGVIARHVRIREEGATRMPISSARSAL